LRREKTDNPISNQVFVALSMFLNEYKLTNKPLRTNFPTSKSTHFVNVSASKTCYLNPHGKSAALAGLADIALHIMT